jgi:hypothetical protein
LGDGNPRSRSAEDEFIRRTEEKLNGTSPEKRVKQDLTRRLHQFVGQPPDRKTQIQMGYIVQAYKKMLIDEGEGDLADRITVTFHPESPTNFAKVHVEPSR